MSPVGAFQNATIEDRARQMLADDLRGTATGRRVRWEQLNRDPLGRILRAIYLAHAEKELAPAELGQ